jgi:predicted N-formylglutamate amidohydrolase
MIDPLASVPDVCEVETLEGSRAREDGAVDLLVEVPHGATRTVDFTAVASRLRGTLPTGLVDFFHVNTDVGAPEVARAIARRVVGARPSWRVRLVRCRIPRTFVDCNRVIDPAAAARPSAKGEMTPGLMPWITHPADRDLLLERYAAYRRVVEAAVEATCGRGGTAVFAHSYAPREVDVAVDADVVRHLHEAYRPGTIERHPLRPEVDLIARDPEGRFLVDEALVERVRAHLRRAGFACAVNGAYPLHPSTMAWMHASRFPGRTLCFEVRRDLLAREFTPFAAMEIDPAKADRVAAPLVEALLDGRP